MPKSSTNPFQHHDLSKHFCVTVSCLNKVVIWRHLVIQIHRAIISGWTCLDFLSRPAAAILSFSLTVLC